jgi:hypothetical protein
MQKNGKILIQKCVIRMSERIIELNGFNGRFYIMYAQNIGTAHEGRHVQGGGSVEGAISVSADGMPYHSLPANAD